VWRGGSSPSLAPGGSQEAVAVVRQHHPIHGHAHPPIILLPARLLAALGVEGERGGRGKRLPCEHAGWAGLSAGQSVWQGGCGERRRQTSVPACRVVAVGLPLAHACAPACIQCNDCCACWRALCVHCIHMCVRAWLRACVSACMHACVRVCARV